MKIEFQITDYSSERISRETFQKYEWVVVRWNFPFLPRIGESIMLYDFINEKDEDKRGLYDKWFVVKDIVWFKRENEKENIIHIQIDEG